MYYNLRELYDLLRSKKFLSCGTRGIVLINDDNTLIKVPRELSSYINGFDDFKNSFMALKRQSSELKKYEENQKKFIYNGEYDFIECAKKMIYINDLYIGVLIRWYKNYNNLLRYKYKDEKELLGLYKKIIEYNKILIDSGIYHMDLLPKNILYNGSNARIIDIDGPAINYNTFLNTKEEDGSYYTIFVGLYSILNELYKNDEDFIDRKEEYIELTSCDRYKRYNYDNANELISVIENRGIFTR